MHPHERRINFVLMLGFYESTSRNLGNKKETKRKEKDDKTEGRIRDQSESVLSHIRTAQPLSTCTWPSQTFAS